MSHRPADDAAWIFQAQPEEWDIDRFLKDLEAGQTNADTAWLVTRYADRMAAEDRLFIWRAGGRKRGGVVAVATITASVTDLADDKPEYQLAPALDKFNGLKPGGRSASSAS